MFNQTGQQVTNQTNIGYSVSDINKMLKFALRRAENLVPEANRDSIRAGTADIIRDAWKMIDD